VDSFPRHYPTKTVRTVDRMSFFVATSNPGLHQADQASDRMVPGMLDDLGSLFKGATSLTKFAANQDPSLKKKDKSLIGKIVDSMKKKHKKYNRSN
jgi:hypothetical protein